MPRIDLQRRRGGDKPDLAVQTFEPRDAGRRPLLEPECQDLDEDDKSDAMTDQLLLTR